MWQKGKDEKVVLFSGYQSQLRNSVRAIQSLRRWIFSCTGANTVVVLKERLHRGKGPMLHVSLLSGPEPLFVLGLH